jgi:hypothetical protein
MSNFFLVMLNKEMQTVLLTLVVISMIVLLGMMVYCDSKLEKSESYSNQNQQQIYSLGSDYPALIYNTAPILPPGAEMGLNFLQPLTQVDGTYHSQDPIYIAGPIPETNPYA